MSRSQRFFRALLRLFPVEFRGDFGDDMAATFNDQARDALAQGDRMAALRLWRDTIAGILTTAPRAHLDVLRNDVRYALRNLRRNPGFTAVAVLALAVGIGANTAVFSIVNGVLLQSLPYKDPGALVLMFEKWPTGPVDKWEFSAPDFEIVRGRARSFSGLAAYRSTTYELSGTMAPQRIIGTKISPELFDVLGVAPAFGRATARRRKSSFSATGCGRARSAATRESSVGRFRSTANPTPSSASCRNSSCFRRAVAAGTPSRRICTCRCRSRRSNAVRSA